MKNRLHVHLLVLVFAAFSATIASAQQSVREVYNQGVILYNQQNYTEAAEKFQMVLKSVPRHPQSRAYYNKCLVAMRSNQGPTRSVEGQLAKIVVPAVDFQQVPLTDVITYIRQRCEELSGGKVTPNIIFNGPVDQKDSTMITMKLNSIPVTTLLKYVGDQARCKIRYDAHAVLVTPYDNSPKPVSSAAGPANDNPFAQ